MAMPKEALKDENELVANVPDVTREGPSGILVGDAEYEVVQQVNVPILKHDSDKVVAVRIEQPIRTELSTREIEVINQATGEVVKGQQENQIAVVRVTELGSGQLFNLVLGSIAASEFARAYPVDNTSGIPAYVGKSFAVKKLGTVAGKRYKDYQIIEIRPKS